MTEVQICVHCKNPVELIDYGDKKQHIVGSLENKFRHARPRPYPVCSVNPIMDEDVETVDEEDV